MSIIFLLLSISSFLTKEPKTISLLPGSCKMMSGINRINSFINPVYLLFFVRQSDHPGGPECLQISGKRILPVRQGLKAVFYKTGFVKTAVKGSGRL